MVQIDMTYTGTLSLSATHGPSGSTIITDAPVDNHGLGRTFSPTDLLVTSVGTCIGTIMAIYAERHDINLEGMTIKLEKHMQSDPRRIGRIPIVISLPVSMDERHRAGIEKAAAHCPVKKSIHPDIDVTMTFEYPQS